MDNLISNLCYAVYEAHRDNVTTGPTTRAAAEYTAIHTIGNGTILCKDGKPYAVVIEGSVENVM